MVLAEINFDEKAREREKIFCLTEEEIRDLETWEGMVTFALVLLQMNVVQV